MAISPSKGVAPGDEVVRGNARTPSSSSSGLSPIPTLPPTVKASKEQKRARESNGSAVSKSTKKVKVSADSANGEKVKDVYCHQCHRICNAYLRCTQLKKKSARTDPVPCNLAFCDKDLTSKYGTSIDAVIHAGIGSDLREEHYLRSGYTWSCPHCRDTCQAADCRRKRGLEPLGLVTGKGGPRKSTNQREADNIPGTSIPKDGVTVNGNGATSTKSRDASSPSLTPPPADKAAPRKKSNAKSKASLINSEPPSHHLDADQQGQNRSPAGIANGGPRPLSNTKTKRPSHSFDLGSDSSELSDPDEIKVVRSSVSTTKKRKSEMGTTKSNTGTAQSTPKKKEQSHGKAKKEEKTGKTGTGKVKKETGKVEGKTKVKDTGKGKAKNGEKEAKEKEKKPRVKPEKKPEVPVDPPVFEKVDTRLGREEVEHRIMLREYLVRFQPVLSIPDRSLPPLDDFDRPITDASVRIFAGAKLDLIKEELSKGEANDDIIELLQQHREELRYFADLARIASAFKNLTGPLGLKMPSAVIPAARGAANAQAIRALLNLDENAETPAWADAGPSRRVAASRLPQPHEVVRMLLALAERTLSTPAIRTDLAWEAPENEARRVHLRVQKKENERWDAQRKKLAEQRVLCKSAAATKANKDETTTATKEHALQLALSNVNLRAALGQRSLRHEPLGVDFDGRVYYCLHIRPVDEDARPPQAWGSGLLIYGIGVPPKPDTPVLEDELPISVERWCHFGRSSDVRQLVKWIEYRLKKHLEMMKPPKTPIKSKSTPAKTPLLKSGKATPGGTSKATKTNTPGGKAKGTPRAIDSTPTKQTPLRFDNSSRPSSSRKTTLEVVIGVQSREETATDDRDDEKDDDQSSSSELSVLSLNEEEVKRELLNQLAPEGYKPSVQMVEEEGRELARKVAEVAEWLEVLEWKGMGEV